MNTDFTPEDPAVLLKIQNRSKPDQVIHVVLDRASSQFKTEGLKPLFGIKEIRIDSTDLLQSLPEYAQVLSFLLETMSAAQDLHLPYGYQNEFSVENIKYSLLEEGDYRVLRRIVGN
jgi:hypothetical protein